jgi:RNA polymerase sigma factor (sigma-70 family)
MCKTQKYYIPINGALIEVTKDVYDSYYQFSRKEQYQEEQAQENGVFSYDALDNGRLLGSELFSNPTDLTLEENIITQELLDLLHRCINALPSADRELIQQLYYNNRSTRSYAKDIGASKSGVSYRHEQILSKLRILMKILGSF